MSSGKEQRSRNSFGTNEPKAYSSIGQILVTLNCAPKGQVVAQFFSFQPDQGLVWDGTWGLGELAAETLALSPCLSFLVVACRARLNLFKVNCRPVLKHTKEHSTGADAPPGFLGVFFREQHVVLVSGAKVTYFNLQLEPVLDFCFAVPAPVVSVSMCDELWAVLAGGETFVCQDKFYVQ